MNNLQLKSHVLAMGLTAQEAADLCNVSKRSFNYWLSGERSVPEDVSLLFFTMASHYSLVLEKMISDVERATLRPTDDEIKPTIRPTLPFFQTFETFLMATECSHVAYWRIYQSVISQLIVLGKISRLDDSSSIPKDWAVWKWLEGHYDFQKSSK